MCTHTHKIIMITDLSPIFVLKRSTIEFLYEVSTCRTSKLCWFFSLLHGRVFILLAEIHVTSCHPTVWRHWVERSRNSYGKVSFFSFFFFLLVFFANSSFLIYIMHPSSSWVLSHPRSKCGAENVEGAVECDQNFRLLKSQRWLSLLWMHVRREQWPMELARHSTLWWCLGGMRAGIISGWMQIGWMTHLRLWPHVRVFKSLSNNMEL